ncbi:MAG TPA: universal stress protein [Candidatus Acidoferrum sp.]|nr:universal stress protein [Candidatus Acidoferrum sp.]
MTGINTMTFQVHPEKRVKISNILALTDFSKDSERALDYALALARAYDARIYLTHVITPDPFAYAEPGYAEITYEKVKQAAEQGIADILISGKLRGLAHEVLLEEGNLWQVVQQLIRKHEIDLVVAGTHGRGEMKKVLLGSVAEEIFRQANCPVLTVGPAIVAGAAKETEFKNILFATNYGKAADRALSYALSLAQEHAAKLTLLHVIEDAAAHTDEGLRRQQEHFTGMLKEMVPEGSENWCKPEFRATFGAATEEILNMAQETKADLIVMGAKASTSFAGHAPLTIAYTVAAHARCPVLTVRG